MSTITCTHDRGRGTTVCLRCRHDEWQASQRRRQQMLMRVLGLGSVVAIIGVAGVGAASTLRDRSGAPVTETSSGNVMLKQEGRGTAPRRPPATVPQGIPTPPSTAGAATATPARVVAPTSTPAPRGGFVLIEGRTKLTDSIYALRTGDSVIVNFDTQGNRTRRADRFERLVRSTLPLVYGKLATSRIDSIPAGTLLPSRDIIGALQSKGMRLTLENGATITVRPLTRVGRDGVLAVAYLTIVER